IAEDEVGRAMDRAFATLVQRVQVPGCRRGKAPRAVLERHLGTETLREEALKKLLPERYAKAVAEAGLSPVAPPSFEVKEPAEGKGLHLIATVDVYPQVTLPDYWALRVAAEDPTVTDESVGRVLGGRRARPAHRV